jgi:hypothetical protein
MSAPSEDTPLVGSATEPSQGFDGCFKWFFRAVRFVGVIVSISTIVAQALTLIMADESIFQAILRFYIELLCVCFILAELDMFQQQLFFFVPFLQRGFMYTFIGLIGVEEAETVKISQNARTHRVQSTLGGKTAGLVIFVASFAMIAVGCIYIIMGALCLRRVYDRVILGKSQEEDEEEVREELSA